jgi:hypothetical protein
MTFKRVGTATGFIGRYGAIGNSTNYQTAGKIGDIANQLRRSFHRGHGGRMMQSMVIALTGAAVGAASKAYTVARVAEREGVPGTGTATGSLVAFGGKRTKVTVTKQSGVTVAQDLTDFDTRIAQKPYPPTYPADKSGAKPGNIGRL